MTPFARRLALWALALVACDPGRADLVVDMRTDLVPAIEFDAVRVRLDGAQVRQHEVDLAVHYLEGGRLATFEDVDLGSHRVELEVMHGDAVVVRRPVLVDVRHATVVTVVVTRDCVATSCPGPSDPANATACLGGVCVDEACSVENPSACPEPACTSAAECPMRAACSVASCDAGACLYGDGGSCGAAAYCDPDDGCLPLEAPVLDCGYAPPTAGVFYVATDGDDGTGDGSDALPWATITNAVLSVPDGSTVLVRPGVYAEQVNPSRRFDEGIVVRSEVPYRAVLRTIGSAIRVAGLSGVTFEGFDITQDPASPTANVVHISSGTAGIPLRLVLRNNIIHDAYAGTLLRCNDDANQVRIEGNLFYNSPSYLAHIADGPDLIVERNVFFQDLGAAGRPTDVGSVMVLSEDNGYGAKRHTIRRNVFMHWEGSPDGGFIEVRRPLEVIVENNLMLGTTAIPMRAPFAIRGASDVTFRNNTIVGEFAADAFGLYVDDSGRGLGGDSLTFFNNIWSSPTGAMTTFSRVAPADVVSPRIGSNLYFNGAVAIPDDPAQALNRSDDASAVVADPMLGALSPGVLPTWDGTRFADGSSTICEVFENVVRRFGVPAAGSPAVGAADPSESAPDDILGRPRTGNTIGAAEP